MAEWLKALVLKTRDGNVRRFESCPFRHNKKKPRGVCFYCDEDRFEPRFAPSRARFLHPVLSAKLKSPTSAFFLARSTNSSTSQEENTNLDDFISGGFNNRFEPRFLTKPVE